MKDHPASGSEEALCASHGRHRVPVHVFHGVARAPWPNRFEEGYRFSLRLSLGVAQNTHPMRIRWPRTHECLSPWGRPPATDTGSVSVRGWIHGQKPKESDSWHESFLVDRHPRRHSGNAWVGATYGAGGATPASNTYWARWACGTSRANGVKPTP